MSSARAWTKSMNGRTTIKAEPITLAAIGDLHVSETNDGRFAEMFGRISDEADVVALCGDLTNFGKIAEVDNLVEELKACTIPTLAVLGNHDYEAGQADEVVKRLQDAGVTILDEQAAVVKGVGFAGVK